MKYCRRLYGAERTSPRRGGGEYENRQLPASIGNPASIACFDVNCC